MQECYPSGCIVIQKYNFCKTKYIIDQISIIKIYIIEKNNLSVFVYIFKGFKILKNKSAVIIG